MSDETFQSLLAFFKALADGSRLRIVGLLAERESSVQELAVALGVREPTVSHHLSKLKSVGLVSVRPDGNVRYYRLNTETLESMSKEVFSEKAIRSMGRDVEVDAWSRKVLDTFVVDGALVSIPTSRKKRQVILDWLASRFEVDRRYPEREVNAIIKPIHPDTATLRRELVGCDLMRREAGVYWRWGQV